MPSGASRNQTLAPADDIVRMFDRAAERARDRVIVLSPAWRTTAGHLDDWSREAAARVGAAALAPGSIVGLVAASGPAFLAGFLGLRRAGCTALLLDVTAATADRARVLDAIGASALLFCDVDARATHFAAKLERLANPRAVDPRPDWAVIQMTSGSTGMPRGVALTSRALLADEDALARTMGIRETDRILAALPMSHRYGFTTLSLAALVRGCQLVMPADAGPLAPIHAGTECGATIFPTVPAYLQALLRMSQPPPWPASLRLCLTAGAPLRPPRPRSFASSRDDPCTCSMARASAAGSATTDPATPANAVRWARPSKAFRLRSCRATDRTPRDCWP
jgi:acyl-CoA synthetase (AMP-forming)/AMP-acid ligase II